MPCVVLLGFKLRRPRGVTATRHYDMANRYFLMYGYKNSRCMTGGIFVPQFEFSTAKIAISCQSCKYWYENRAKIYAKFA